MSEHIDGCIGFHTDEVTCQDAIEWRANSILNPWICWTSRNGYHCFDFTSPDDSCLYGCGTTRESLRRSDYQ